MVDTKLKIWGEIVNELKHLQDQRSCEFPNRPIYNHYNGDVVDKYSCDSVNTKGAINNSICGYPLIFDSACAANVFAVEYKRTGEQKWYDRSISAINFIEQFDLYNGVHELKWDPLGWHFDEKSIYTTTLVLDSYWNTKKILELSYRENLPRCCENLGNYLEECRPDVGRFSHYILTHESQPRDVQNSTAMGLFVRSYAQSKLGDTEEYIKDVPQKTVDHLVLGQRPDGFWPYTYPGEIQRSLYKLPLFERFATHKLIRKTILRGSRSILYGDSSHHCYTLYYLLRTLEQTDINISIDVIQNAWYWIEEHLTLSDSSVKFNFSWEPNLERSIQFSVNYDTTTYFLIIGILPHLCSASIINREHSDDLINKIFNHIYNNLLQPKMPCITPHECDYEQRRRIAPAIWWSVAFKGSILANYIHNENL